MTLAICVVVDESKCLDCHLGISRYCVRCLSIAAWQSGDDIHDFCCCHSRSWRSLFGEYCVRPWIIFLQYHLGVQLDLFTFGALPPTQHFSNDKGPTMRQNELLRPTSLLHRSPLFYFWLSSNSTPKIFSTFPISCPPLLFLLEILWLEA